MNLPKTKVFRLGLMVCAVPLLNATRSADFASHPPMRPLPAASSRPLPGTPVYFVDAERGQDRGSCSLAEPWKSVTFALKQCRPGEIAVIDAGLREFFLESPDTAWQPAEDGRKDE